LTDFSPENDPLLIPEAAPEKQGWRNFVQEILETLGLAVLLFLVINIISARVRVDGFSMRPSLQDGEFVLINRLAYQVGSFHHGDIIVFRPPMYPEADFFRRLLGLPNISDDYEDYIKRIIGLPGDTVKIEKGEVRIIPANGPCQQEISSFWVITAITRPTRTPGAFCPNRMSLARHWWSTGLSQTGRC
jgi:signal peptidase I